uniref:Uncharacterized protein n=1 Tax=Arundo donax TaxID=35708 RepID=A0A0A8YVA2_ARUDO
MPTSLARTSCCEWTGILCARGSKTRSAAKTRPNFG